MIRLTVGEMQQAIIDNPSIPMGQAIVQAQVKKVLTIIENLEDNPAYYYKELGKIATLGDLKQALLKECEN